MQEWVDLYKRLWSPSKTSLSCIISFKNSQLLLKFLNQIIHSFPFYKQYVTYRLQTRISDWREGALDSRHLVDKLFDADKQLKEYEESAAPPGWTCHWDRYCISLVFCQGGNLACLEQQAWIHHNELLSERRDFRYNVLYCFDLTTS